MADSAGELTFTFGADFSAFTRAVDSAGQQLDALAQATSRWSDGAPGSVARRLDTAALAPLQRSSTLSAAAQALRNPPVTVRPASSSGDDPEATKELNHLADQLALLKTTGAAHDAIVERIKIETEQAKLGTDATEAQKQAVAALVVQIDAAKASQSSLKAEQAATNQAWSFGSNQAQQGLETMILYGGRLQDVARTMLQSFAQQGLSAALTGSGSLAGLFGTRGSGGQVGGLFGALQSFFSGGLSGSGGLSSLSGAFSGLYAAGGSIGAGQWGIVGEKGAEVVAGPATVVPWSKVATAASSSSGAAPQQTINFNVSTPDAPSFARSETQMASILARAVGRGQRNQ